METSQLSLANIHRSCGLEEIYNFGNESFDSEENNGVEGMTFHLLELLSTLVLRPNVQALVKQGLVPLMTTVSHYLLI